MRKINDIKVINKYFLFIFGKIDSITKEFLKDIILDLNYGDEAKYYTLNNGIVFHFISNVHVSELNDTIKIAVKDQKISDTYFLIQSTDKVSVELPLIDGNQFFNIQPKAVNADELIFDDDNYEMFKLLEYLDSYEEEDDEDGFEFVQQKKKNNENTLDYILEKIKQNGINSLTQQEHNYLKNYN